MTRGALASVLAAGFAVAALTTACEAAVLTNERPPVNWPSPPETLAPQVLPAPATDQVDTTRLSCGGDRTFERAALTEPPGAETREGPMFDALRLTLVKFRSEFADTSQMTFRKVLEDDVGAIFLAEADEVRWGAPYAEVRVRREAGGWAVDGMGGCRPKVVLAADIGPASWILDPAVALPDASSSVLSILVWEETCSSGSPATGRIAPPRVEVTGTTVTITLGVRPLGGMQTCPRPPGTPATVDLGQPLGDRVLLDGGRHPPAPPTSEP